MSDEQVIAVVLENERLKGALKACRAFAEQSSFGGWRFKVAAICNTVLGGR